MQCTNFTQIEDTITNVYILCRQKFCTNNVSEAEKKQQEAGLIKDHPIDPDVKNENREQISEEDPVSDYKSTTNYKWLMTLYNSVPVVEDASLADKYIILRKLGNYY